VSSSAVALCNQALRLLGEAEISSFDEGTDLANTCSVLWEDTCRSLLAQYPWRFTLKKQQLSRLADAPLNEWSYAHALPPDLLTLREIFAAAGAGAPRVLAYERFEGQIYSNTATLWADYQVQTDPATWPPAFRLLARYALASEFAVPVTGSLSAANGWAVRAYGSPAEGGNGGQIRIARRLDAQQQPPQAIEDFPLVAARHGGTAAGRWRPMRLTRMVQTSFTAGELDPRLYARLETTKYYSGASLLRNVLVMPQGGIRRHPGMRHLSRLNDGTDGVRAIPFAFNTEQTYAFALTAGTFRVWTADGVLRATVTGCPWNAAQAAAMNYAQSADTLLLFHPDIAPQRIRRGATDADWTREATPFKNLPTHDYGAVTVAADISLAASADSGAGIILIASAASFTAAMVGWEVEAAGGRARITAYTSTTQVTARMVQPLATDHPAGTVQASATSGAGVTLTASVASFNADMVGWDIFGNGGKARITAFTSTKVVVATTSSKFTDTTATSGWRLAETGWSLREPVISATRGWPGCGTFHSGRLYLGGFRSRPATFAGSRVAGFFDFFEGTGLDDEAFMVTIDSDQVNAIRQMRSGKALQVFTSGAEYAVTVAPPITPTNINVEEQSRRGIAPHVPVVEVDGATLFVQRGGAGLRQFVFADLEQQYRAELLSLLAPHLIVSPVDLAARKGASSDDADHVLLVRGDGDVAVLTTLRSQEIAAFTRWETAGESLAACALQSGEVFFAVLRDGTVRMEIWDEECLMDAAALTSSGTPVTSVSGLDHLNGLTVGLYLDGAYQGTAPVLVNAVTLPRPALAVEVGLPWTPAGETLPLEPRDQTGALIGRKCRVVKLTARVERTALFELNGAAVVLRGFGTGATTPLDTPPPIHSGDVTVRGNLGWRERNTVTFAQATPGPFTLLALGHQLAIADPWSKLSPGR
jgi:hypothetical protein